MTFLLDTHALLWFLVGDAQLSTQARSVIEDENNELLFSIAGLWEIAIKTSLGKLTLSKPFEELFPQQLENNDIAVLSITVDHLRTLLDLPFHHRDPFDRLLIAQAKCDNLSLISADSALDLYGIRREW